MSSAPAGRMLAKSIGAFLLSASLLASVAPVLAAVPAGDAAAVETADSGEPGEITILARKRAENAQEVPIPVTVISPVELTRQNLVNFTNFQNKFPSFSVFLTNPKQLNLGIRGIGNNGFNTDGIDGSVGRCVGRCSRRWT